LSLDRRHAITALSLIIGNQWYGVRQYFLVLFFWNFYILWLKKVWLQVCLT